MIVSKYVDWANRVYDWNGVAGEHTPNVSERISSQRDITIEEVKETQDAIEANDVDEILDGIGDILVTASYLNFLCTSNRPQECYDIEVSAKVDMLDLKSLVNEIRYYVDRTRVSHYDIQRLILTAFVLFGEGRVTNYIERILASNDSKFIPADQYDEQVEKEWCEKMYCHTEFYNIIPVLRQLGDKDVFVLRANYGKGKILKPSQYKKPLDLVLQSA